MNQINHKDIPLDSYVIRIKDSNVYLIEVDKATYSIFFKETINGWLLYNKQDAIDTVEHINNMTDLNVEYIRYRIAYTQHALPKIQSILN